MTQNATDNLAYSGTTTKTVNIGQWRQVGRHIATTATARCQLSLRILPCKYYQWAYRFVHSYVPSL